ncbi:hypothetical protein LTR95_008332 [Oleoguttula sp. CCFEE 5521]
MAPTVSTDIELANSTTSTTGLSPDSSNNTAPIAATSALTPVDLTLPVKLKLSSAILCFFNAGINDGSLGALLPYILRHYALSTSQIAFCYLAAFLGWLFAALLNSYARLRIGDGGLIIAGAALQVIAQLFRFWIPPFGVFAVTFGIVALGQGTQEPSANTFVSGVTGSHRWLGAVHGCYALGGLCGPLIATAIASHGNWATFYYVPTGIGALNLALCGYAFRDQVVWGKVSGDQSSTRQSKTALRELSATVKQKSVWQLSLFFFLYLGACITAGGWVVEFLVVVRDGDLASVGYVAAAFNGGTALGRFVLAEPTYRWGEKRMLTIYGIASVALELVFWLVPNIVVNAVMVCIMGFVLGPFFATGISVGSKIIPTELQASGLAMIFVMAQAGGAGFPALTGIISGHVGVQALQPMLVALLSLMVISWLFVPNPRKLGSDSIAA